MTVLGFLDAGSLAAFSETNFECFYFLELQLQRALLIGEGCGAGAGGMAHTEEHYHHFDAGHHAHDDDHVDDANISQNDRRRS